MHTEGFSKRTASVRQVVLAPCLGDPWLEHSRQYVERREQQDMLGSFHAVVIEIG